jgi:Arc/MetJ-type ribon-helix-helix transcriptional regulator
MAKITLEITDAMQAYIDRKVATGAFKNTADVVEKLLMLAIRAEQKNDIDAKLLEASDQIDRGECAPWEPGEGRRLLAELTARKAAEYLLKKNEELYRRLA